MHLGNHGGGCCGIRHLYGFTGHSDEQLRIDIAAFRRDVTPHPRLMEAVVTDGQERTWGEILRRQGFRKVVRFFNGNTSNHCNIYMYYDDPRFEVFDPDQTVPPLPAAPQVEQAPARVPAGAGGAVPTFDRRADVAVGTRVVFNDAGYFGGNRVRGLIGTVTSQNRWDGNGRLINVTYPAAEPFSAYTHMFYPAPVEGGQGQARLAQVADENAGWTHVYSYAGHRWHRRRVRIVENRGANSLVVMEGEADRLVVRANRLANLNAPVATQPPVPRAERRAVLIEFFAHLRTGQIKGPYNSRLAAQEGFPRCRNFDRRTFWSDGTFSTEEGVQ